jgi:hypothetical protein
MKRKRRDIREFAFNYDYEHIAIVAKENALLDRYGFIDYYDSTYEDEYSEDDKQLFLSAVSSYKSLEEYKKRFKYSAFNDKYAHRNTIRFGCKISKNKRRIRQSRYKRKIYKIVT